MKAVICAVFAFNKIHVGEHLLTYICGSKDQQDSKCVLFHVHINIRDSTQSFEHKFVWFGKGFNIWARTAHWRATSATETNRKDVCERDMPGIELHCKFHTQLKKAEVYSQNYQQGRSCYKSSVVDVLRVCASASERWVRDRECTLNGEWAGASKECRRNKDDDISKSTQSPLVFLLTLLEEVTVGLHRKWRLGCSTMAQQFQVISQKENILIRFIWIHINYFKN